MISFSFLKLIYANTSFLLILALYTFPFWLNLVANHFALFSSKVHDKALILSLLNVVNPDEYLEFVRNYLPIIVPSENIQNRIIFTSYLYLYDEDTDEEKEDILHNAFKFSKVPVCVDNYEYIYDFSNEVTVCNDKDFKKLVLKLFSKNAYEETFFEEIY